MIPLNPARCHAADEIRRGKDLQRESFAKASNATTRDEDYRWSRTSSAEARLERVWFGSGHDLTIRALTVRRGQLRDAA